ncbi:glycoside hydrolase family 32 protein [Pseudonocardia sp. MCCB 268]|nr:glycoside hydrolase family 32 protein [Pseudonocardia cytotoxica]
MHWSHASSADRMTWTDHGVALAPTPGGRDESTGRGRAARSSDGCRPPSTPAWTAPTASAR